MKLSRDGWLGAGILILLLVVTVATVLQQNHQIEIPYLSTSSNPQGALALKLWLKELGFTPFEEIETVFQPPADSTLVFILQPTFPIAKAEWKSLDDWVNAGGTLILAGDNFPTSDAINHFDFSWAYLETSATELSISSPLFHSPAVTTQIPAPADLAFTSLRTDFVILLNSGKSPIMLSFKQGQGQVILCSAPYLFSNLGLKNDAAAETLLNLAALPADKGKVWFDEWHHGFQAALGPGEWLKHTPGGHALLFTVAVVFLALLLQGRAFGRPIPLAHEMKRRGPLEHVTAIANLNRKAGHRAEVLRHYHQRVKRQLGRRYRLDPTLADGEYVALLAQYNPDIDKDALQRLLSKLSQKSISEASLVTLASQAAQWIKE